NLAWWNKLAPDVRRFLEDSFKELTEKQWQFGGVEFTQDGIDCNSNRPSCRIGSPAKDSPMVEAKATEADKALLQKALAEHVLPDAAGDLIDAGLIPTLTDLDAARAYDDAVALARPGRPIDVFVKVDVGLERLGVPADQAVKLVLAIRDLPRLRLAGLCTHLHVPQGVDPAYVEWQFGRFTAVLDALAAQGVDVPIRLAASSPLVLGFPSTYLNAVDPGRMLYGYGHEAVAGPVVLRPTF